MPKNNKNRKDGFTRTPNFGVTPKGGGFTLLETLVALSIFTVSLIGIISILASGISATSYVKQKLTAEYLAQEGIEYARNQRDNAMLYQQSVGGWNSFLHANGDSNDNVNPPQPLDTKFQRTVTKTFIPSASDELIVTSTVTWTKGSGQQVVIFTEHLFNWVE